jgi:hypothetical protein
MFGIGVIPGILQMFGMIFVPESPRWLVKDGQLQLASHGLRAILGSDEAAANALENIKESLSPSTEEPTFIQLFSNHRRAVIVGVGLQVLQ